MMVQHLDHNLLPSSSSPKNTQAQLTYGFKTNNPVLQLCCNVCRGQKGKHANSSRPTRSSDRIGGEIKSLIILLLHWSTDVRGGGQIARRSRVNRKYTTSPIFPF